MWAREAAPAEPARRPFGERLHPPPTSVREPKGARITAGPAAPLLIRLVRTPFSLQPVRPSRVEVPDPWSVDRRHAERPAAPEGPGRAFAELQAELGRGSRPFGEDRRPPARPRPFARAARAVDGEGR
ncbi:MAG: hypothetical protein ABMA64_10010 [Myxococcota bacterium]